MKIWIKRTLWGATITVLSVIVLLLGAIAMAVNFIFTPAKLTPVVERIAEQYIDADLGFSSVELTFFSTFPHFGVRISDGQLTATVRPDSMAVLRKLPPNGPTTDTIVSFESIDITVNPLAYLTHNRLVINNIKLDKPRIYAFVSADGSPNWDIIRSDSSDMAADSVAADSVSASFDADISVGGLAISDGRITFDDRQNGIYTHADTINLRLRGNLAARTSDLDMEMSLRRGLLWQNGELIFNKVDLGIKAVAALDSSTLAIDHAIVDLNRIRFGFGGSVSGDSVDLKFGLDVPSLATLLALVPPSVVRPDVKLSTTGSVALNGTLRGGYRLGAVPVLRVEMSVDNATARYQGQPMGIDSLRIKGSMLLDLGRNEQSYINIENFKFSGADANITAGGSINNLLGNQIFDITTRGDLDLGSLSKIFPLQGGVTLDGMLSVDLRGRVSRQQLIRGDYARIKAEGEISMTEVALVDTASEFYFISPRSKFDFSNSASGKNENLLTVKATLDTLRLAIDRRIVASMAGVYADLSGAVLSDSLSSMNGAVGYTCLDVSMAADTIAVHSGTTRATIELSKSPRFTFSSDSLMLRALSTRMYLDRSGFALTLNEGKARGIVGFEGLRISTPALPLAIEMPRTKVTLSGNVLSLREARLRVGRSDVTLTGTVSGVLAASKGEGPLVMTANLKSPLVDLTELINAMNAATHVINMSDTVAGTARGLSESLLGSTSATTSAADSTTQARIESDSMSLFEVPDMVKFDLITSIDRVEFGQLSLNNVRGGVHINRGTVRLDGLALTTMGAEMVTSALYRTQSPLKAEAGFAVEAHDIDVGSVMRLIPSIDSLVPMLRSFEGVVDFGITANAEIGPGMSLDPGAIQAAVSIHGEDLRLLDGETFAEVSKMLMFKNKKENVVDSLSVQMTVHDGKVEIFPFLLQIDRYRVAVGGEHKLDNNFNYHISVLKSPIPFKMGINISGSLDDMKVGIGKTQYKFMNEPTRSTVLNPNFVELRANIMKEAGLKL